MGKKILVIGYTMLFLCSIILFFNQPIHSESIDFEITFYNGWNMITIPVENSYWASTLAENITGCSMISRFDAEDQAYKTFIVGGPSGFDFQIEDGMGLEILVDTDSTLTVSGEPLSEIIVSVLEGYNLIGWVESSSTTASAIINSIGGCINVSIFDAVNQVYKNYLSPDDEDFTISRGMGYFVEIETLDSTPPVTNAQLFGPKDGYERYMDDVTVTLTAIDDASAIYLTKYQINGGNWQTYQAPFTISDEGHYTISYYSVDYSGNIESVKSTSFQINKVQTEQLMIGVVSSITEEEEFQVTVTANDVLIDDVVISFYGNSYLTNSEGIVTLTAPSVDHDTSYTILASKTGYVSNDEAILVLDKKTDITLLSPNGGEVWSNTHSIIWSISDSPINPYALTIQYKYEENEWINIVENVPSENTIYNWDTKLVTDGYPYFIKVILKEDTTGDGIYESITSEDISDNSFAIDNSYSHQGWIYGKIIKEIDEPVENARIYILLSDEEGIITSKFTFSDINGNYSIPVPAGEYTIEVSKKDFQSITIENTIVWANVATEVNFVMISGQDPDPTKYPIYLNEYREVIDDGIKNHTIGGEITIQLDDNQIDFEKFIYIYNDVTITPEEIKENNLSLIIDGDEDNNGRTIVINVCIGLFDSSEDIVIKYDGEIIRMADNISDILNPNNDGSHPEYLIVVGSNGIQILVSIPHFSEHKISVYASSLDNVVKEVMRYKEVAIITAIGIIAIAALVMFRKGKEE